jgi:hypothetical protein
MLNSTMRLIKWMASCDKALIALSTKETGKPLMYQSLKIKAYDYILKGCKINHCFYADMDGNNNFKQTVVAMLRECNSNGIQAEKALSAMSDWTIFAAYRETIKHCGLNVMQLNEEHVYGLQHTDMKFNTSSFNMPYPVVIVELPANIGLEGHEGCLPQTVAILRDDSTKNMAITFEDNNQNFVLTLCEKDREFEDIFNDGYDISKHKIPPIEINAMRVALLALHISCQSPCLSYQNDSGLAKEAIRTLSIKTSNKSWMKPTTRFFRFNQELKTFNGTVEKNSSNVSGIRKVILKRKGHTRNQPHGPKSSLRKLIWIKPYFNKLVVGDRTNLTTTFEFNNDIPSNDVI